jgi:hypothetical protein
MLALLAIAAVVPAFADDAVKISAEDCHRLLPTDAGGADYRPGVDVHGNKVAPADLGGGYGNMVPEDINIHIGVDLAARIGLGQAARAGVSNPTVANEPLLPYDGVVPVGTVTMQGGAVLWNGKPLVPQDQVALAEACRDALGASQPPPPKPTPP